MNNIITALCISSVKHSPANAIKVSATILILVSFSLFDTCRRDSVKPGKNILLLLGVAVAYEHCVTIKHFR